MLRQVRNESKYDQLKQKNHVLETIIQTGRIKPYRVENTGSYTITIYLHCYSSCRSDVNTIKAENKVKKNCFLCISSRHYFQFPKQASLIKATLASRKHSCRKGDVSGDSQIYLKATPPQWPSSSCRPAGYLPTCRVLSKPSSQLQPTIRFWHCQAPDTVTIDNISMLTPSIYKPSQSPSTNSVTLANQTLEASNSDSTSKWLWLHKHATYSCYQHLVEHRPISCTNPSSLWKPMHSTTNWPTTKTLINQHMYQTQWTTISCDLIQNNTRNRSTPSATLTPNCNPDDKQQKSIFHQFSKITIRYLYIKQIDIV